MSDPRRVRENLEGLPVDLIDGLRARRQARCMDCRDDRVVHPNAGMVRFEWATTARPDGFWYYRDADLVGPSVLRRDHVFVEDRDPPPAA